VPFFAGSSAALDPARYLLYLLASAAGAGIILWLLHRYWLSRLSPKPPSLAASFLEKTLAAGLGALGLVILCLLVPAAAGSFRTSATGWAAFDYPAGPPGAKGAAETGAVFLFQSLSEELLFRGVVMGALGTALLFLFSHETVHALPGEPLDSDRAMAQAGPRAAVMLHRAADQVLGGLPNTAPLPEQFRATAANYLAVDILAAEHAAVAFRYRGQEFEQPPVILNFGAKARKLRRVGGIENGRALR
jgi:membrane protease YdiL (CAAX protease family)